MQLLERERALLIDALKAQIAESLSPSPPRSGAHGSNGGATPTSGVRMHATAPRPSDSGTSSAPAPSESLAQESGSLRSQREHELSIALLSDEESEVEFEIVLPGGERRSIGALTIGVHSPVAEKTVELLRSHVSSLHRELREEKAEAWRWKGEALQSNLALLVPRAASSAESTDAARADAENAEDEARMDAILRAAAVGEESSEVPPSSSPASSAPKPRVSFTRPPAVPPLQQQQQEEEQHAQQAPAMATPERPARATTWERAADRAALRSPSSSPDQLSAPSPPRSPVLNRASLQPQRSGRWQSKLSPRSGGRVANLKGMLKAFILADSDGSGEVDTEELLTILPSGTNLERAQQLMQRFDVDRSGSLSRSEFIKLQKHLWSIEDTESGR